MLERLPNVLSLFRIALIPVLIYFYLSGVENSNYICAFIFFVATITDWLDGKIARMYNVQSQFGAFIDPVADKLLVSPILIMIAVDIQTVFFTMATLVIISREIIISSLREWMAELNLRNIVAVSWLGKSKTMLQMTALFILLLDNGSELQSVGLFILYISALLSLLSMFDYLRGAGKFLAR